MVRTLHVKRFITLTVLSSLCHVKYLLSVTGTRKTAEVLQADFRSVSRTELKVQVNRTQTADSKLHFSPCRTVRVVDHNGQRLL